MTTTTYPGIPEDAARTPDAWCANCGDAPGDRLYLPARHPRPGTCLLPSGLTEPRDPATLVDLAVMGVLQETLQLGYGQPGGLLARGMATRILTMITDTLDVYTTGDGTSSSGGTR